jgi:hypothetical protein
MLFPFLHKNFIFILVVFNFTLLHLDPKLHFLHFIPRVLREEKEVSRKWERKEKMVG